MTKFCDSNKLNCEIAYPVGATIGNIVKDFDVPISELFLILVNGKDVAPGCVSDVRLTHQLEDGDVVALSGPVPYSFGYDAPVV